MHPHETLASHMPILLAIFDNFKIKSAIEFGTGLYSTKLLTDRCKEVVSLEMESTNWYGFMVSKFLHVIYDRNLENYQKHYDLVFIDGDLRAECVGFGFQYGSIVVLHDSQHAWTKDINISADFRGIDFVEFPLQYPEIGGMLAQNPWTTLFTNRNDVYDYFKNINENDLYNRYKFPYVYDNIPDSFPEEK